MLCKMMKKSKEGLIKITHIMELIKISFTRGYLRIVLWFSTYLLIYSDGSLLAHCKLNNFTSRSTLSSSYVCDFTCNTVSLFSSFGNNTNCMSTVSVHPYVFVSLLKILFAYCY